MEMSREDLLRLHKEIQHFNSTSIWFMYQNAAKIKAFYAKNDDTLNLIFKKLDDLYAAHVDRDEKGNYIIIEEPGKPRQFQFKSGKDDKLFQEAYTSFMSKMTTVH